MNNLIRLGKKILSVGVTFTTVLWSIGIAALLPTAAVAAACSTTLNPGDEIKVKGAPAIYVLNNKLEVIAFPVGDVYKSYKPNYGGYISITDECYQTLKGPSAQPLYVNYRPGTYVIQRESSSQLYVSEPGNTIAKITPEAAKALYGTYKPMMVQNAWFGSYVSTGADITEVKAHPGMLLKKDGKYWYVDAMSKLQEVTDTGLTANGFQTKFSHVATDAMISGFGTGEKITAEVKALTDRTQMGGAAAPVVGTTPAPVVGGALTVALAADTPFSTTLVSDSDTSGGTGAQALIPMVKLAFTAGSDGDSKVTSLKLKRTGVSADTDISNMYLYDGDKLLASSPSVSNNYVTFTNSAGLFTVSKGSAMTVTVKLDLKNNTASGKTIGFGINAKEDVVSNSPSVGGSFPLSGNLFTTALVSDLGTLVFANVSPTAAGTVDPGTTGFEIWRFRATNTDQDVEIRKLKFTLVGSINAGDLTNFALFDGAKQVGTTVAAMDADKTVTMDWSAAPYVVTKGQIKNLSLRADVVAGTNRTFYVSFQNSADIATFDKNYGVYLKSNGTDTFTIVQAGGASSVNWTVNVGTLTQTLASDSPTGNIADGATNVTLAKFLWKANGEDIKVSSLSVSTTVSRAAATFVNTRLLVNGSQVGSTDTQTTNAGVADAGWGSFGNSFIIKAGTTASVTIVADTTDTDFVANDTGTVGVVLGSSNAQGVVSLTNINTVAQNANLLTVKGGTVTVAKNSAFGDKSSSNPNGTVNASGMQVASWVITAGAGESVDISQIVVQDNSTTDCIGDFMQNLVLKDAAGKQLGTTYSSPSGTCTTANSYTFNLTPAVTLAAGAQYTVNMFADLKAAYTTGGALIKYASVTASGHDTGTSANDSTALAMQANYISGSGTFLVQVDSDTPVATNHLMGATDQVVGKFRLIASSTEAVNITQFVVSTKFSSGATGTMTNIRLVDDGTGLQVGSAVSSFGDVVAGTDAASTTYSHATFSGLNFSIPKGSTKILSLKVDFTTYSAGGFSTTGQSFAPVVLVSYYGQSGNSPITANGASSGSALTATVSAENSANFTGGGLGNGVLGAFAPTTTLYRAKLATAWATDTPYGAASAGASQLVAKFTIKNLANAEGNVATVSLINFNFATSISQAGAVGATRALTLYRDSNGGTTLATTNFASTQTFSAANSGNTAITAGNFTSVQISSGAEKTFFVTLDTTDAASQKNLSVRIGSAQVTWGDGVSTGITSMAQDLPLQYKTFTY